MPGVAKKFDSNQKQLEQDDKNLVSVEEITHTHNVFVLEKVAARKIDKTEFKKLKAVAYSFNVGRSSKSVWFWFSKRIFDFVFALAALVLLSPLLVLIAIAIRLNSKGPIFFQHERVGERLKIFKVYKFRTMHEGVSTHPKAIYDNSDKKYRRPTIFEDPRITSIGRFLRSWSLDELPQLVNIIKGDMSLIGPRPLTLEESLVFPEKGLIRYSVPSGLTGLAQITDRFSNTDPDRYVNDIDYVNKLGFIQEFKIFVKSFYAIRDKY